MSFELDRLANQLDWNLLRTFMVIVQERSITSAAARLNVTQPSVSAALRRLEERLDVQLIERGAGRVFQITGAGETVYREALEMYGGVVRLNELSRENDQVLSGNIVIYRSSHLDISDISRVLSAFRTLHPAVTYSMTTTSCADVVRALQQRVASLGFCTRPEAFPHMVRHKLDSQDFAFFCGPDHPLFGIERPDPLHLAASDVVGFEGETLTGALSQIVRFRARFDIGENMVATTSSIVDLIAMLHHMPAIGCMAVSHAARYGPELWRLPLDPPSLAIDRYAITDTERHVTPAERALMNYLQDRKLLLEARKP